MEWSGGGDDGVIDLTGSQDMPVTCLGDFSWFLSQFVSVTSVTDSAVGLFTHSVINIGHMIGETGFKVIHCNVNPVSAGVSKCIKRLRVCKFLDALASLKPHYSSEFHHFFRLLNMYISNLLQIY